MSSTTRNSPNGFPTGFPGPFSFSFPPPSNTAPVDNSGGSGGQPKSSSLYLFTFLSTLFLLLVVSTAIVLRSFLLRRRYRMGLQEQLGEIFQHPGDTPGVPKRKNFGAKPKLWEAWIKLDDGGKDSVHEYANIKPLAVTFVPQETTKTKNLSSTSPDSQSEQERRNERSSAFLASLFAHPPPLTRHIFENERSGGDSANSSTELSRTVQVSVVISMPTLYHKKPHVSDPAEEEFPNVAIGFARLPIANE